MLQMGVLRISTILVGRSFVPFFRSIAGSTSTVCSSTPCCTGLSRGPSRVLFTTLVPLSAKSRLRMPTDAQPESPSVAGEAVPLLRHVLRRHLEDPFELEVGVV